MYVLGVNGWNSGTHDASACLFRDGQMIAAAEEERFSRQKKAFNALPYHAIGYCLHEADISASVIDQVAVGWDIGKLTGSEVTAQQVLNTILPKHLFPRKREPECRMYAHHAAHAAGAYFSSGFDQAAILVIDGSGEDISATIAKGDDGTIRMMDTMRIHQSIGIFYEAASIYLGFGRFNEGKTMGLSSYGDDVYSFPDILAGPPGFTPGTLAPDELYSRTTAAWIAYMQKVTRLPLLQPKYAYSVLDAKLKAGSDVMPYRSLAASAQKALERAAVALVRQAVERTGCRHVCISGGVGLNCVANGIVAGLEQVEELYIQPAASDSGTSIGAATLLLSEHGIRPHIDRTHVYSGPEYSSDAIERLLRHNNINYEVLGDNSADRISELLLQNKVVARFHGKMEFGPRALGNRSIIANPQQRDMLVRVNRIKHREQWRPLAPSLIEEAAGQVLKNAVGGSPYMILNAYITDEYRSQIPAVVHVDGSARAQVVDKAFNPEYWRLIRAFWEKSGVPAVINTSFNIGNEPIVCSPGHAIRSFFGSELDALLLENILLVKQVNIG
ncbi:carbamoyltransferase C-terminal domain-containing protein [Paenibacillus thiaminolyticus]|uniref:Carbamoyl transferase n=1 Tax=Paenibacillus thiaminolyticus TaxID=49283 RepID=A0A3A3GS33_PANTH|nr:carbamoyltransferase C-terminal domain-containing protein [Paenibacillus thiaminolyticus]RJG26175.1 carbamoyl transferase [Paenibacillus thiaminolyticus]